MHLNQNKAFGSDSDNDREIKHTKKLAVVFQKKLYCPHYIDRRRRRSK